MGKYFDRFGLVDYNGVIARNLLTKVDLTPSSKEEVYAKFQYTIENDITSPDLLSYITYNNTHYDWAVMLTNNIIDPYHDIYQTDEQLADTIKAKFRNEANAQRLILYYRNNWADDNIKLTPSQYEDLTTNVKKYYRPEINTFNQIVAYQRNDEDWIQSTNKIQTLEVEDTTWIPDAGYVQQGSASAYVTMVDRESNIVTIQHVDGLFTLGSFKGTNITSIRTLVQNIPDEEGRFWSKVTAYDAIQEENELKRFITLIRNSYIHDFEVKFEEKIKQ